MIYMGFFIYNRLITLFSYLSVNECKMNFLDYKNL